MILKKFLKFEKSSLDDSYKKDSYKKDLCMPIDQDIPIYFIDIEVIDGN